MQKQESEDEYSDDDESEEAKAAFDDFWKSEDIMKDDDTPFYDPE